MMTNSPFQQITEVFNKFSIQQKLTIGFALVISLVIFIVMFFFMNQPNYSVLYTNLSDTDASNVITYLNSQKISYELGDNGKTIKVPKKQLYQARLSLAAKGIPNSGVIGYEIFDKNTMGMSQFMQKLNYKRALEGELTRTIMKVDGVLGARVLIVIPKKSIFKEEQKPTKASVVIKLRGGYQLSQQNITAITNLVSNSVENLSTQNVSLIDTRGRLLSKKNDNSPTNLFNTKQYEIKKSVENYLADKATTLLDKVIGVNNSTVQVNADFNFERVEKTIQTFDPESQVAISEQTVKNENSGKTVSDSTSQLSSTNTINYEVNKTIQKVINGSGNIKNLSIAVVVNDLSKEVTTGGKTTTVYEPRTPEQMKKLKSIIIDAIGINEKRGDRISVVNIPFEKKDITDLKVEKPSITNYIDKIVKYALMIISLFASLIILRGILKKLKAEKIVLPSDLTANNPVSNFSRRIQNSQLDVLPDDLQLATSLGGGNGNGNMGANRKSFLSSGNLEDEITDEALNNLNQKEKVSDYVSKNPDEAAKLINTWLYDNGSKRN